MTFCEDHKTFHASSGFSDTFGGSVSSCCNKFFNTVPFFTAAGTCYTTNVDIIETFPSVYSSIRMWLYVNETHSPSKIVCKTAQLLKNLRCTRMNLLCRFWHVTFGIRRYREERRQVGTKLQRSPSKDSGGHSWKVRLGIIKLVAITKEFVSINLTKVLKYFFSLTLLN